MTVRLSKIPWYYPGRTEPGDWFVIKTEDSRIGYLHKNNLKFLVAKPNFVI